MKRLAAIFLALICLALAAPAGAQAPVKNLIVMIADGAGSAHFTLARWMKGRPLATDAMASGVLGAQIADSAVADSAPAATAFATGYFSGEKLISMSPGRVTMPGVPQPKVPYRPLATVLEGARLLGKATGVVSTSRVTHATPAAFMAHVYSRYHEGDIMEQAVAQGVDVLFGGGERYLRPQAAGGRRKDGQDLAARLEAGGYTLITRADQLAGVDAMPVAGLFSPGHLAAELERPQWAPDQPSLAVTTQKALDLLSKHPGGFFLMVEGSQVDWACHSNDPGYLCSELIMFDLAVTKALEFARQNPGTQLLVFSDHNTGGLALGNARNQLNYQQTSLKRLLGPLKKMRVTSRRLWKSIAKPVTAQKVIAAVKKWWAVELSLEQAEEIMALSRLAQKYPKRYQAFYGVGQVVSRYHTLIGWTSHGHTGTDVPLFAFGPWRPAGRINEPQLGRVMFELLGLDLAALNERLFQDAAKALPQSQVKVDLSGKAGPVIRISHEGRRASLPVNQNLLLLDGRSIPLEGVVVYSQPTGKAYLPMQAVNLITGQDRPLPGVKAGE